MYTTFRVSCLLLEKQMRSHLKRLSSPYGCKDMVPLFGPNPTELRLTFTLDFIYQRNHHRLELWNLQPPYLQGYADAAPGKGAPI